MKQTCFRCGRPLRMGTDYGGRMYGPKCLRLIAERLNMVAVSSATDSDGQLDWIAENTDTALPNSRIG